MKNKAQNIIDNVERAIAELRRGQFIILLKGKNKFLMGAAENISAKNLKTIKSLTKKPTKFLISKQRANSLFARSFQTSLEMDSAKIELHLAIRILGVDLSSITRREEEKVLAVSNPNSEVDAALLLVKYAELLPAIFFAPLSKNIKGYAIVNAEEIKKYERLIADSLKQVSEAPLTLIGGVTAKILSFRPQFGGKEHHAIIIGKPGVVPFVRVHSSCFTGDLLASIKCDCRDQLQGAIKYMGQNDGGIIIYLMQEGRGIGLVNKLRAYRLQANGMDTVEANEHLGFDDDERPFLPAAKILKLLNVKALKLLSNNPNKAKELEKAGIKVEKLVPLKIAQTEYTKDYLTTKANKLGHIL